MSQCLLYFLEERVVFDSKNREAVMKEEALRSVSLDHSLSFSVRVISYATASAVWTDTPERECSDQMRRCVGKEGFWEKKECKSSFWREVTGHFRTDRTYIYCPQVCLCMLCSRANKWEVSLKMECVNENTRLGSVCAPAADELLCEVYAREHMHSNTRTHTHKHECSVFSMTIVSVAAFF